jgi:hypothetical protein
VIRRVAAAAANGDPAHVPVTVTLSPGRVHCSCVTYHNRFLCRHMFTVMRNVISAEETQMEVPYSPGQYGERVLQFIGSTPWVGGFRQANLARAVQGGGGGGGGGVVVV